MKASDLRAKESAFVSGLLHDLSQPLTALECGLEISLGQDQTVAELRHRMEVLLEIAQTLHQKLEEMRRKQESACEGVPRQRGATHAGSIGRKSGGHS